MAMLGTWNKEVDRAWRNARMRRRFEEEEGFQPIALQGRDLEIQIRSGDYARYELAFKLWATRILSIQQIAPDPIRQSLHA
jgi:hypothetical protein